MLKSRASRALSGAIAAILLLLVSMAAAGDIHLLGYDKDCGLCQFSQIALDLSSSATILLSASPSLLQVNISPIADPRQQSLPNHLCRAPPLPSPGI